MADSTQDTIAGPTSLYREFLAERDEILRHKWIKSEEAGSDIGFEDALVDWTVNHRAKWKKAYLKSLKPD
ncbi:MAG: hypothetical protein AAGA96_19255 [Verrucomicrobiota bacterium]